MADITKDKPAPCEQIARRTFVQWAFLGLTVVVGLLAAGFLVVPLVLYFMGPIRKRTTPPVNLGPISKFRTYLNRVKKPFPVEFAKGWAARFSEPIIEDRNELKSRYRGKLPPLIVQARGLPVPMLIRSVEGIGKTTPDRGRGRPGRGGEGRRRGRPRGPGE